MAKPKGNFVSEWFGHRVYPVVVSTKRSLADQRTERCPFLSATIGEKRLCIKSEASKGVCTINSASNGRRQDWLVCPYRALDQTLVGNAIRRLFALPSESAPMILPAVKLETENMRRTVSKRLDAGEHVYTYFEAKLGGELSIPPTDRSPEFSFDVTVIELIKGDNVPRIGRFGILEIQTMDFHGSYRSAVRNLTEGLRMHGDRFGRTLQEYAHWLGEGVEGPNIANVFKRTFYQMMFKFRLGQHGRCAGCVLAIPQAVWESWQRHLGAPDLTEKPDGTFRLLKPGQPEQETMPAWIYIFDTEISESITPSPIRLSKMIGTDVPAIAHWALDVAPRAAVENIDATAGFMTVLERRLKPIWPELARTAALG